MSPRRNAGLSGSTTMTAPLLRITVADLPGIARVVRLDGEVDHDQREQLEDALAHAVADRPPQLVVDLAGLAFCDCAGVNALLKARRQASACGVGLMLVCPPPQVSRLLELTGTGAVFTIRPMVNAASRPRRLSQRPRSPERSPRHSSL
ncbi:STAS domain-containing protein [Kitasatospora purpeofusca]|uniref:STAS domain-containing protein n=1 Tax=Kitasatospora purpeofusca TaxID=67352 RepID=UPI0036E7AF44